MPLKVWVAVKSSGTILCAHCTCMAGAGEACSHISSVLFAAEANTHVKEQHSSTSLPCSWLPPSFRSIEYAQICNIDFATPKQKRRRVDEVCSKSKPAYKIPKPTADDIHGHYEQLSALKVNPVLLSLVAEFNDSYIPLYEKGVLPKPLVLLYEETIFSYPDLLKKCEQVYKDMTLTAEQVKTVEEKTRDQSGSKLWFQQRAGRVTASKLRSVLHTKVTDPSKSLISSICYDPESTRFYSKACMYGCEHEDDARKVYCEVMNKEHNSFSVTKCGLFLDISQPFIGASPDGMVHCSCCGKGALEIKCPYSCKDKTLEEACKEKSFCLLSEDGNLILKKDHMYYYQIQMQLKVCQVLYCDFVVWNKGQLLRQRIMYDSQFIEDALKKVEGFVKQCILPELIAKWFTQPIADRISVTSSTASASSSTTTNASSDDVVLQAQSDENVLSTSTYADGDSTVSVQGLDTGRDSSDMASTCANMGRNKLWCYCRQDETYDYMIGCDNEQCPIQWFHLSCVHMTMDDVPEGNWLCPECSRSV